MFKDINPVGKVCQIEEINLKVEEYKKMWNDMIHAKSIWKSKVDLSKVTVFMLLVMDDFVNIISTKAIPGADKKATVLDALDKVFEYVVKEAVPVWLKPFISPLKNYVVYILMSTAIDWMVDKYKNGSWRGLETN
jgi:hypothetical protein